MTTTTETDTIDRRSWLALYLLCGGMLMIVLDATIVNVALPAIQDDLGFTQSSLAWVVNSYLIAFGGLLMLSGRLGDLIGRRNMFVAGLAAFTVASVLCGVAQDQTTLVVARFLQGAGGGMTPTRPSPSSVTRPRRPSALTGIAMRSPTVRPASPAGRVDGQDVSPKTLEDVHNELRKIEPAAFPDVERVDLPNGKGVIALRVPSGVGPYAYDGRPYTRYGPTTIRVRRPFPGGPRPDPAATANP